MCQSMTLQLWALLKKLGRMGALLFRREKIIYLKQEGAQKGTKGTSIYWYVIM